MSKNVTDLRLMMETSLEGSTKKGTGGMTDSLGISPYGLIWYLAILFFIFPSGAQPYPFKKNADSPTKLY